MRAARRSRPKDASEVNPGAPGETQRARWAEQPTRSDLRCLLTPEHWSDVEPPSLLARLAVLLGVVEDPTA